MTFSETNILQFNDNGFEFLFDFSSELISKGVVPGDKAVDDRVVAIFGKSIKTFVRRDASRIRRFLGGPIQYVEKGVAIKVISLGILSEGGLT